MRDLDEMKASVTLGINILLGGLFVMCLRVYILPLKKPTWELTAVKLYMSIIIKP